MKKIFKKLPDLLFFLSILFFTVGLNLQDNPPGGWYQQFLPDVNNMPISDIEFLDSLVGFAVTGDGTVGDTNYIIKTTNGGDNWFINFRAYKNFERVIFINNNVGYVCGGLNDIYGALYKTTNAGGNWIRLNTPFAINYEDMSVLNEDTIWVVDDSGFDGGVFRTTNGGQNWTQQFNVIGTNPSAIYMYNGKLGFFNQGLGPFGNLYRTTNSGENWIKVQAEYGFEDMLFIDSLTGYKAYGIMKKTTNGGLDWQTQTLPSGAIFLVSNMYKFSVLNRDTLWGVGGTISFNPYNYRGIIWKTTNAGDNWGFQIPDTSIHLWSYYYIDFSNKLNGWAFVPIPNTGIHTTTGGNDTTIYMEMKPISTEIPGGYKLHQNYPNPFNYSTRIKFDISKNSYVALKVYNLLGKEIDEIVNSKINAGSYDFKFVGSELTSGVYLCRLVVDDNKIDTKKMVLIK
ncbi:T9SS type A sorting domain-containing protein [Bacteroidota bacterium]